MNTLIYKMTHAGDPDEYGVFGAHDCMGKIRAQDFGAVLGVAGKTWDGREDEAGRIRWIGSNPNKVEAGKRGPLVTFEHYVPYENGPELRTAAPKLFKYMLEGKIPRHAMSKNLPREIQAEIVELLLAEKLKNAKPFPLTDAICIPPNGFLNPTVSRRTTKRCCGLN